MFASLLFICFQTPTQMQFFELWFSIRKMITLMLIDWLLIQILATARRNRITFGTQMNQHSSRSHALLCITVQGTDLATGSKTTGQLLMHFWFKMELYTRVSNIRCGGQNQHIKNANPARWTALENIKEGIHFWTFACIVFQVCSSPPPQPFMLFYVLWLRDSCGSELLEVFL